MPYVSCDNVVSKPGLLRGRTQSGGGGHPMSHHSYSGQPVPRGPRGRRRVAAAVFALIAAVAVAACGSSSSGGSSSSSGSGGKKVKIALILKTFSNPYFVSMKTSAKADASKLGVDLNVSAGTTDGDTQ